MFLYRSEVETTSLRHGLKANLVHAIVLVESSGNRFAWNPEPKYRYFWDIRDKKPFRTVTRDEIESKFPPSDFLGPPGTDPDQEWWAQQASWGLMQVMGAVAREFGFQERFLPQLCEASYGLEFGCSVLKSLLRWSNGDVAAALAAYNGGRKGNAPSNIPKRNQGYVNKVMLRLQEVDLDFGGVRRA
jgi:hypothetical protein